MDTYILFAIIFLVIGYLMGRHHQWSIDDEIPVLFLCKEKEESENDCDQTKTVKEDVIIYRGEWTTINECSADAGVVVPCDDGKYLMLFRDITSVENKEAYVNTAKKHKLNNYDYMMIKLLSARRIKKLD